MLTSNAGNRGILTGVAAWVLDMNQVPARSSDYAAGSRTAPSYRTGIRLSRGLVMRSETKIALLPLLLAVAACTAIDTEDAQPAVAQDQSAPRRHERAHHEHDKHQHEDAQHPPKHEQQHQHASAPAQPDGAAPQIWETDAPLREGMRNIRAALNTLEAGRADGLSSGEADDFAAQIDKQVAFLIDNCKLQPQADAALHTIIADLAGAAHSLKSDPAKLDAFASMHAALRRYARQFDDPEWRSDPPAIAE
jgi:hypothetical protein